MTAHPLALIAGMSDGIDVEQREQIDDHIASCDTCRTHARAIERTDRLIASPEPSLALPPRATAERPRGHAMTVLATVAAGVLLVVVASVVRQSFQQTAARPAWADMVAQGNDACDLVPAGRTVYVKELPRQPFPAVPRPFHTFGFEGQCGYGYHEGWFDFHLLMDAEPTARGEALPVWREFLREQDCVIGSGCPTATSRSWSTSEKASPGGVAAVRWWTTGVTAGHQWSMMGVWAESYFFVVTAETTDRASQFADAVLNELKKRPWPSDAWRSNACMVIDRAAAQGGLSAGSAAQPTDLLRYGSSSFVFRSNICAYGWQYAPNHPDWWEAPNLFLRTGATMPGDVQQLLLADPLDLPGAAIPPLERIDEWTLVDDGIWLAHARTPDDRRWSAVAVLSGSQFFIVTFDSDDKAIRLARAVAAELKR